MSDFHNPSPTVLAVIIRDSKILLVKRAQDPFAGYWDIPGGFMEAGESLEEAMRRELKEELAAEVVSLKYMASYPSIYPYHGIDERVLGIAFRVELAADGWKARDDITQFKWFDLDSLPEIAPLPDVQGVIKDLTH